MKNNTIDLIKELEKHFMKFKNFYIAILLSLIIIFCWCNFCKRILDKDYQDPNHIVMDMPRGGVQTRKNKKLIDDAKNNFGFKY